MFPQRYPSGTGLTYGLNYPTPNKDHLVQGLQRTKRVTRLLVLNGSTILIENHCQRQVH